MRSLFRLALGLLALLVGARIWATLAGGRRRGLYYLSGARQVRLLFWPLAGLVASLPFALAVIRRAADLPGLAFAGATALAAALLSLSIPALVLHGRYRRHDAATAVLFDPGDGLLEIRRPDRPFVRVRTTDIRSALHVRPRASRAFWAAYETLLLDFAPATGQAPLMLTSGVLDLAPITTWLRASGVAVTEQRRWLAWV
ncbi:MAG: hypothetical protein H7330_05265 [Hymenobacteraceae bacterium]|nr:hypothetical protein [Hymenobacteraceae bacterium]